MAEVRFTRRALADLKSHDVWLGIRDPRAVDRLAAEVAAAARLLSEHPLSGRAISGLGLRVSLTRRLRYRLICRVRGTRVTVVRVLHPRQAGPA